MTDAFSEWPACYELTLDLEGGRDGKGLLVYSNLRNDPGGPTTAGLALLTSGIVRLDRDKDGRLDFDLDGDGDVDAQDMILLRSQPAMHREFFRERYWVASRAHEMPWPWSALVYDAAVHHGVGAATLLLQRVVGADEDGKPGPATVARVRIAAPHRTQRYLAKRAVLFRAICDRRGLPWFEAWMNRLAKLMSEVAAP